MGFILALISTFYIFVPFCIEYTVGYMLMFIVMIIGLKLVDYDSEKLYILWFISGIITCFCDFLVTPTLTIFAPLLITLVVMYKNKKITSGWEGIKYVVKSVMLWGIAYSTMWLAKWTIATIVLGENAFDLAISRALKGMYGNNLLMSVIMPKSILFNIENLFPLCLMNGYGKFVFVSILIIILIALLVNRKRIKDVWVYIIIFMLMFMPYVKYLIVPYQSALRDYFVFREQFVTIMGITLLVVMIVKLRKEEKK